MAGFNSGAMAMRELTHANRGGNNAASGGSSGANAPLSAFDRQMERDRWFEAAYHGHLEVLAVLCDSDADVDVGWTASHTGMGYTAREIALLCGHIQVMRLLP